jgi:ATP-dependent Clp protease ATP-binding subunit ClpA
MAEDNTSTLLSAGFELIARLFQAATKRLQDRKISLVWGQSVADWLIERSDWQESLNPLKTLDGFWHQQIASVVERMLLDSRLVEGQSLTIAIDDSSSPKQLQFKVGNRIV